MAEVLLEIARQSSAVFLLLGCHHFSLFCGSGLLLLLADWPHRFFLLLLPLDWLGRLEALDQDEIEGLFTRVGLWFFVEVELMLEGDFCD